MLRFKILLVAALGLLNILESVALLQEDYVRVLTKPDGTKNIIMMVRKRIIICQIIF